MSPNLSPDCDYIVVLYVTVKVKPSVTGPEGSRRVRFSDKTIGT